jgi:hypothetical protein
MATGTKQMGNISSFSSLPHPIPIFKIALLVIPVVRQCSIKHLLRLL